ncbi:hypothetical protein [Hominenteromicrobium sp.]|uniref:hypothetical protein n=1 Tax=Hominenteromicrobium sp. TaxID=3073581 RepID=UPI003AB29F54
MLRIALLRWLCICIRIRLIDCQRILVFRIGYLLIFKKIICTLRILRTTLRIGALVFFPVSAFILLRAGIAVLRILIFRKQHLIRLQVSLLTRRHISIPKPLIRRHTAYAQCHRSKHRSRSLYGLSLIHAFTYPYSKTHRSLFAGA